jgi:lipid A disaccharide synthetase
MRKLKECSPSPITFIGLGGDKMKAEGLDRSYGDIT